MSEKQKHSGFAEGEYDLVSEGKKLLNKPSEAAYLKAKEASLSGELKLVNEFIMQPHQGHGFELKKGPSKGRDT